MKKIFCDCCEQQLTKNNTLPVVETGSYAIEGYKYAKKIKIKLDYTEDLCKYCVVDIISTIDDRPKAIEG